MSVLAFSLPTKLVLLGVSMLTQEFGSKATAYGSALVAALFVFAMPLQGSPRICYKNVNSTCSISPQECNGGDCEPCGGFKYQQQGIVSYENAWTGLSAVTAISQPCLAKYECVNGAPNYAACGSINGETQRKCQQGAFVAHLNLSFYVAVGNNCDCNAGPNEP